ncbi:histidine phosphotransferase family protein [Roseovarius sp. D22-M7]|uniref:histidine phosphotransferase family protein n=1 Tax=Roseovarius sp. D22-M7 TaxID=3127116 RepID=UPI0030104F5A
MPQADPALELMIGSRICHDLASPLGAVANGLELLTLSGMGDSEELALVQDSLRGAMATLDLSRLAFGRTGTGESLGAATLHEIAAGHYAGKPRLTLDWQLADAQPRARAQIVMLACLCAEQAVPRGGRLVVAGDATGARITAQGTPPVPDHALWAGVTGAAALPDPDPRQAHFHMLRHCLDAQGLALTTRADPDAFTVTV